ncbi:unnamed protein product, partial [Phaeothamnion confervicola]
DTTANAAAAAAAVAFGSAANDSALRQELLDLVERADDAAALDVRLHAALGGPSVAGGTMAAPLLGRALLDGGGVGCAQPPNKRQRRNLLQQCARYGRSRCLALLLRDYAADRNAATVGDGFTASHFAAFHGHIGSLLVLAAYGADPALRNSAGETVAEAALVGGHPAAAATLRAFWRRPALVLGYGTGGYGSSYGSSCGGCTVGMPVVTPVRMAGAPAARCRVLQENLAFAMNRHRRAPGSGAVTRWSRCLPPDGPPGVTTTAAA